MAVRGLDSRSTLLSITEEVSQKIKLHACDLSSSEASALGHLLSGFCLATNSILKNQPDTFIELRVDIPASSGNDQLSAAEPNVLNTYLDTASMKMLYNPTYYPTDNVAGNYSTIWRRSHTILMNYITPGAALQLTQDEENPNPYWTVTFGTENVQDVTISKEVDGRMEIFVEMVTAVSTKKERSSRSSERLYLVPITALEGVGGCGGSATCREIVASPISLIKGKKTFLWSTLDVTGRVDETPVSVI